jgi:hypothetical protein
MVYPSATSPFCCSRLEIQQILSTTLLPAPLLQIPRQLKQDGDAQIVLPGGRKEK